MQLTTLLPPTNRSVHREICSTIARRDWFAEFANSNSILGLGKQLACCWTRITYLNKKDIIWSYRLLDNHFRFETFEQWGSSEHPLYFTYALNVISQMDSVNNFNFICNNFNFIWKDSLIPIKIVGELFANCLGIPALYTKNINLYRTTWRFFTNALNAKH